MPSIARDTRSCLEIGSDLSSSDSHSSKHWTRRMRTSPSIHVGVGGTLERTGTVRTTATGMQRGHTTRRRGGGTRIEVQCVDGAGGGGRPAPAQRQGPRAVGHVQRRATKRTRAGARCNASPVADHVEREGGCSAPCHRAAARVLGSVLQSKTSGTGGRWNRLMERPRCPAL